MPATNLLNFFKLSISLCCLSLFSLRKTEEINPPSEFLIGLIMISVPLRPNCVSASSDSISGFSPPRAAFLVFCFSAFHLFCFSASQLFCFSASLLFCFSAFLFRFSAFPPLSFSAFQLLSHQTALARSPSVSQPSQLLKSATYLLSGPLFTLLRKLNG